MMDDDDAVPRQVHVELEPFGAAGHAVVERRNRVFGTKRRPATMGVNDGHAPHLNRFGSASSVCGTDDTGVTGAPRIRARMCPPHPDEDWLEDVVKSPGRFRAGRRGGVRRDIGNAAA